MQDTFGKSGNSEEGTSGFSLLGVSCLPSDPEACGED